MANKATKSLKDLKARFKATGERLADRRANYDSPRDKITHPEWFDENNNRTPKHPKYGEKRSPRSSLPIKKARGGKVKKMAKGGKVRGCGCAKRGLTKGKMR
jgi:hypothetical protein